MSQDFFKNLQGFSSFSEACNSEHYHPAPADWFVVLTDVQGSTKAIEEGRYKDVNMVGVACITAIVNACPDVDIPYVFGGDGATFLVPSENIEVVKKELLAVSGYAEAMHGLKLRCCAIPMNEVIKNNKVFGVAKFVMPTGASLAMFNGNGVSFTEDLMKNDDRFSIQDDGNEAPPNLEGLSCRWQPIPAKRGTILTLLVMSISQNDEDKIYREINNFITQTLNEDVNPISEENMSYKWPTFEALRQSQMVWRQGNVLKNLFRHIFEITLFSIMNRFGLKLSGLDVQEYKKDIIKNSDYQKFDGVLRMVIDCSEEQATAIESYLEDLCDAGEIVYGTHYSDTALMTCFVELLEKDKHVHFIDGNDGGYALAAKKMKEKLKKFTNP